MMATDYLVWVVLLVVLFFAVVLLAVLGRFLRLWVQALFAGCRISVFDLIGMALRKTRPEPIVLSLIRATRAGLSLTVQQLESHHLAGGHVPETVAALIQATKADLPLDWQTLTAVDLAGRDVTEYVASAARAGRAPSGGNEPPAPQARRADEAADERGRLLGAQCTAETHIPPAGRLEIEGETYPAVSAKGPIEKGTPVEVVDVVTHVVVRPKR